MEGERLWNICLVLGCIRCAKKWDIILHDISPSLKYFQGFLDTHCANCGSDKGAIELIGIEKLH